MINFCKWGSKGLEIIGSGKSAPEITFFQVKILYNAAYEQKAQARLALRRFKRMEAQARRLEDAYRAQLNLVQRAA